MNVVIVGTGYVGLVTGVVLSYIGHKVICVDKDHTKIQTLAQGTPTIYEPGLEKLLKDTLATGQLSFTVDLNQAMLSAQVVFICVGTPPTPEGNVDLQYVRNVANEIGRAWLGTPLVVVDKSTVPPGTSQMVREQILRYADYSWSNKLSVVSNPEFLREGCAIYDMFHPERIVVGSQAEDSAARVIMSELYAVIRYQRYAVHPTTQEVTLNANADSPLPKYINTDPETAELAKYAANAFLATKISFINELSALCEELGADVKQLAEIMGSDSRIGSSFLRAGVGWGGSCFGKDTLGLLATAEHYQVPLSIVYAARQANLAQQQRLCARFLDALHNPKKVTLLGLAFKPNTDDIRDSPALVLAHYFHTAGLQVSVYDPLLSRRLETEQVNATYVLHPTLEEALEDSDGVMLVTEWPEFKQYQWHDLRHYVNSRVFFDGRNCLDSRAMSLAGWVYFNVGCP